MSFALPKKGRSKSAQKTEREMLQQGMRHIENVAAWHAPYGGWDCALQSEIEGGDRLAPSATSMKKVSPHLGFCVDRQRRVEKYTSCVDWCGLKVLKLCVNNVSKSWGREGGFQLWKECAQAPLGF